jgi:serine/threonine protein kinase
MTNDSEFTAKAFDDNGEVLLGSGGTADCYKRIVSNRAYCIKRPKAAWRHSEAYMDLFRKEFTLGVELEHPNIVRYFDYGEDEQGPFIKMDYVDGERLDSFAAKHPEFLESKENRQQLLDELLDALAYLHGKQMLHLDLKPGNILITNKGHRVKLIDLGFGWTEGFLQEGGFSRDYSAPEQLNHQTEQIGVATDIYALGKIMQQFLLAKDSVVKRCLKEDPKERFQSIEALRKALRPKRWPFLLLAALLLGALGWLLTSTLKPREPAPMQHNTELILEYSLKLFKEDLQNALAPTFSYWYSGIHDAINDYYAASKGFSTEQRLEIMEFYINKALDISQGVIKEKINTLHLSETARPQYEKAAQEVVDYYLQDYEKLKEEVEKE